VNINFLYHQAVRLLKGKIAIPSLSGNEQAVAAYLSDYLTSAAMAHVRIGNNICAYSPRNKDGQKLLMLNSHIDTVKPVAGWTKNPFFPEEDGDRLFGLGSNDAGASVVSLLQVFFLLTETEQPNNFIFLASCEEEISGKDGIESVLPELPAIDFALVGEPTGMQPAIAERGLMVLDAIVKGESGHAARNEGDNALYKAIPVINWFKETKFPLKSELLGEVKMTVTKIHSGTQHNVVPDECRFTVDVRTNECYTNREIFDYIVANCGCEVKVRTFRLNSSGISMEHPFVLRTKLLGLKTFGSPTLSDQALMSFPSLKMGPGHSSRSHTADEYILQSEIREAIDIYFRLLTGLQSGKEGQA